MITRSTNYEVNVINYYKILTIALILWRLGYSLRTLNTLSQVTGYPNYRVSIYLKDNSVWSETLEKQGMELPQLVKGMGITSTHLIKLF